jgi:hypothetical protein
MSTSAVSIAVDGPGATVRLVRPDKRNAVNEEAGLSLEAFLRGRTAHSALNAASELTNRAGMPCHRPKWTSSPP